MKINHIARYLGVAVMVALFVPTFTLAGDKHNQNGQVGEKVSKDALAADPTKPVPVIIQFKDADESGQDAAISSAGGSMGKHFHHVKAVATQLPASSLQPLAFDPNVAYISLDRPIGARQVSTVSAEYTSEPINAPGVWSQGYDGTGVGVAVIDSGITSITDLNSKASSGNSKKTSSSRIVYSQNFLPSTSKKDPGTDDQYGHGTHVAGLIAGNGAASTGSAYYRTFSGAAPNANLINLRVLDANGLGSDSSVIAAIETAIALKDVYNIRVINLSLGRPIWESYKLDPLCQAAEAAWKAGIVVVVAAGNDGRDQALNPEGYGTIEAPGNDPYVLTVGALRTMGTASIGDDAIASYSSKGPSFIDHIAKPDLVAPGNLVTSLGFKKAVLQGQNPDFVTLESFYINGGKNKSSSDYYPLSGTSMATGVTSGSVALLLQAQPNLTPDNVKALLMRSANHTAFPLVTSVTDQTTGVTYVSHYDLFTIGAGYLDIRAAVNDAYLNGSSMPTGTAMSPVAVYDAASGNTSLVTDQTALWGTTILWGAKNAYGTRAFVSPANGVPALTGQAALWGTTILWGARNTSFTALWSANSPWSTSSPAAASILWGASGVDSSSALWGATSVSGSTILWGAKRMMY